MNEEQTEVFNQLIDPIKKYLDGLGYPFVLAVQVDGPDSGHVRIATIVGTGGAAQNSVTPPMYIIRDVAENIGDYISQIAAAMEEKRETRIIAEPIPVIFND